MAEYDKNLAVAGTHTLETKGLRKRYGRRVVVKDVSLRVKSGEVVGLLGPNGAGKTTTFYMVVGLIVADGGSIYLDGKDITHLPIYRRAHMGLTYLPQEASVFRSLTVEDNIRAILELQKNEAGKPLSKTEINERLEPRSYYNNRYRKKVSFLHDIWNPWHGCVKCSEGCQNCYMYFLDRMRDQNGAEIYKTKSGFSYPLQKDRTGHYKIQSGEQIRVCMTSDFFLEEADPWRVEAWDIMRQRSDVVFFLLTKRPQRVRECLPPDWGSGWDNIFFNVTCENQRRADERIPILFDLPFKHKGIMCAPFIGPVSIRQYLSAGQIEQVICGGENYDGARPCNFDWVKSLRQECVDANVTFCFIETGTVFIKDGRRYHLPSKQLQSRMAYKSGMNFQGRPIHFDLVDDWGYPIPQEDLYVPHFRANCETCGSKLICNGCSDCGKCL